MDESEKLTIKRDRVARALLSYLPPDAAEKRAVEIAAILELGENGQTMRASVWEVLGRLDDHANVPVQIRAAAVSAVLHAWGRDHR